MSGGAGLERAASGEPVRDRGGLREIAPDVTAWLAPNGGWGESNAALICGPKSSVLVDTLWDLPRTSAMLQALQPKLASAPIAQLVNTHSDGDHWFGNQLAGATEIIATKSAARRMKDHGPGEMRALWAVSRVCRTISYAPIPWRRDWRVVADYFDGMTRPFDFAGIRPALPNWTFSGKAQIEAGGRRVELIEVGPAHTRGDLVVFLPDEGILLAGDIVFAGTTPVLWDGSAGNWMRACERILRWKVNAVLPGHGPMTDLSGVDAVRQYWLFLRKAARAQFDRGRPPAVAAIRILESDEYQAQPAARWDGQERIMINVHAIYRRLMRRGRTVSAIERLDVLRKTALLARRLTRPAAPPREAPVS